MTTPHIALCEPAAGDIDPETGVCACGCGNRSLDYDMRVRRGDADPRIVHGIGPHHGLQERAATLAALGLDDASLDAAWDDAMRILAAEGYDVPAVLARASAALDHYHA